MHGQDHAAKTPADYIAALAEPRRSEVAAADAFIRKAVPKLKPTMMMGMLGYGPFHYRYASGREGDTCTVGLASNKQHVSLYICAMNEKGYLAEQYAARLGTLSCGKSCIRFKNFSDLDPAALKALLIEAAKTAAEPSLSSRGAQRRRISDAALLRTSPLGSQDPSSLRYSG